MPSSSESPRITADEAEGSIPAVDAMNRDMEPTFDALHSVDADRPTHETRSAITDILPVKRVEQIINHPDVLKADSDNARLELMKDLIHEDLRSVRPEMADDEREGLALEFADTLLKHVGETLDEKPDEDSDRGVAEADPIPDTPEADASAAHEPEKDTAATSADDADSDAGKEPSVTAEPDRSADDNELRDESEEAEKTKVKEFAASLRSGTLLKFPHGLVWRVYDIEQKDGDYLVSVTDKETKTRYPELNVARLVELFGQWGFPEVETPKRAPRKKTLPAKPRTAKKEPEGSVVADTEPVDSKPDVESVKAVNPVESEDPGAMSNPESSNTGTESPPLPTSDAPEKVPVGAPETAPEETPDEPTTKGADAPEGEQPTPETPTPETPTPEETKPEATPEEKLAVARNTFIQATRMRGNVLRGRLGKIFGGRMIAVDGKQEYLSGARGKELYEAVRAEYESQLEASRLKDLQEFSQQLEREAAEHGPMSPEVRAARLQEKIIELINVEDAFIEDALLNHVQRGTLERAKNWWKQNWGKRLLFGGALATASIVTGGSGVVLGARMAMGGAGGYIGAEAGLERVRWMGLSQKGLVDEVAKSRARMKDDEFDQYLKDNYTPEKIAVELGRLRMLSIVKGQSIYKAGAGGEKQSSAVHSLQRRYLEHVAETVRTSGEKEPTGSALAKALHEKLATESKAFNEHVVDANQKERLKRMKRKSIAAVVGVTAGALIGRTLIEKGVEHIDKGVEKITDVISGSEAEAASGTASNAHVGNLSDFEVGEPSSAIEHDDFNYDAIVKESNTPFEPLPPLEGATVEAASATAEAAPTATVEVSVQKGEGMINALSRTIEAQYGVDHDTAMEIANKTWAKNPSDWYNVVHEGDVFKVSLEGMDPADLANADPAEVAKHLEFSSDQFTAKSGIDPAHEFASVTPQVAEAPAVVAEKAFEATTGPAVADFESVLAAKESGRIGMNPLAESFMAEHGIRINPDTFEFGVDVSGDGSISAQEVILKPGSHLKDISRMDILFNPENKTLVLETLSGDGATKEVLTLDSQLNVVDGYTESLRMDDIIQLKGRALSKTMKAFGAYHEISDKLAANTAGLDRALQTLKVEDVLSGKKEAIKVLVDDGLRPRDAKRLLKPLWAGFNVLQKNGVHLSAGDTVSSIIERASQSPV